MSGTESGETKAVESPLKELARLISLETERFQNENGDEEISRLSKQAMVQGFDQAVQSETLALPSITSLLHSYLPSSKSSNARSTRASKRKRGSQSESEQSPSSSSSSIDPTTLPPHELFQKTPLDHLVVKGMKEGQIWKQLELKTSKMVKLVESVVINEIGNMGEAEEEQDDEEEEDSSDKKKRKKSKLAEDEDEDDEEGMDLDQEGEEEEEEEEEDEEEMQLSSLSDSELKALGLSPLQIQAFRSGIMNGTQAEGEGEQEGEVSDSDSAGGDGYPGASDLSDEDEAEISFEPLRSEEEQLRRKKEKEEEEFRNLRGLRSARNSLRQTEEASESESESDSDIDSDDEDEDGIDMDLDQQDADLLRMVQEEEEEERKAKAKGKGKVKGKGKGKGKGKEVMADGFFGETDQKPNKEPKSLLDRLDEDESGEDFKSKNGSSRHPTLDDDFFSIDAFNRLTENSERNNGSLGNLDNSGGENLEDDLDLFQNFETNQDDDAEEEEEEMSKPSPSSSSSKRRNKIDPVLKPASEISYSDFFDPPPRSSSASSSRGKSRASASKDGPSKKAKSPTQLSLEDQGGDQDVGNQADGIAIREANLKESKNRKETEIQVQKQKEKSKSKEEKDDEKERERKSKVRFVEQVKIKPIKARKSSDEEILRELLNGGNDGQEFEDEEDEEDDEDDEEEEGETDEDDEEEEDEQDEDEGDQLASMNEEFGEDDQEDLDSEEEEEAEELGDGDGDVADRVAGDLFDDDDESHDVNQSSGQSQSAHERRMAALKAEISQLEEENVAPREWTLTGEASSKSRPSNSLLERDLDFEHINKSVPQATDSKTSSIEELIKARILSNEFDDVIRRRNLDGQRDEFLPSKIFDLDDTKGKSLNEIYEDEFSNAQASARGFEIEHEKDTALKKEHEEIKSIFDDTCAMLDALSNAHYTPKAPKVDIQTISDVPRISMETSLPTSNSTSSMLAPEEIYSLPKHSISMQGSSSEREIGESKKLHDKIRKEKKKKNEILDKVRKNREMNRNEINASNGGRGDGLGVKNRLRIGDEKKEKEKALKNLIGNKGVSVIGKGDQKAIKSKNQKGKAKEKGKGAGKDADNSNQNWKL